MLRVGSAAVFAALGHAIGTRVQNLHSVGAVTMMVLKERQKRRRVTTVLKYQQPRR